MPAGRAFVKDKRPDWERLEALLGKIDRDGLRSLSEAEAIELARLYRKATSDLAQAQTFVRDADVLHYLNGLVGRAHGVLYRADALTFRGGLRFFLVEWPARVRRHGRAVLASAAVLFGSMLFGYLVVAADFEARDYVLPDAFRSIERGLAEQERWAESMTPDVAPAASAWIMTNNIRVSFLAFASGAFLGVGTFLVLGFNGLMLGAVMATVHHYGKLAMLLAFVASHGVIELTCICIAGGAGFVLASGLVSPGDLAVKDALVERARDAALLVLGTVPLLAIAGLIEGFISPLAVPHAFHAVFALVPAGALALHLAQGWRGEGRSRGLQTSLQRR